MVEPPIKLPPGFDRPVPRLAIKPDSPAWLHELERNGYAIIPGVLSAEKARAYADRGEDWLEGFKFGYKRDDPTTYSVDKLPKHIKGGLYALYSFGHSQFVWDIKSEPSIVDIFAKIWGTQNLTVSFDGGNLSVPLPEEQIEDHGRPWPHADQHCLRHGLHSVQGLINLLSNGPQDGGLTILKGSSKLWKQYNETFPTAREALTEADWHLIDEKSEQWYFDQGCEWVKPSLNPGDFVVWDSRTVHYGQSPKGHNKRFAVYICMKPVQELSAAQKQLKMKAFHEGLTTTHDPCNFMLKKLEEGNVCFPYGRPVLNDVGKRLAGLEAY